MNKLKPKITLDKDILAKINAFYNLKIGNSALYNPCFSHPSLDFHTCNPIALLDGGEKCNFCNHAPGGICKITCHINHYCLAVFAFRLGIGGDNFDSAVIYNLKMKYRKLYKLVLEKIGNEDDNLMDETAQDLAKVEINSEEDKMSKKKETKKQTKKQEVTKQDVSGDLISISDAAKLYQCSYHNIYVHVRKGNLEKIKGRDDKNYVRKADVMAMIEKNKNDK